MPDQPICWKCGAELAKFPISGEKRKWRCDPCDLYMSDREAFNPEIAKAHHEEAEKGPEAKELTPERIEAIVEFFETARVASATMKKLFPMLFNEPGLSGMPDPTAMGEMAGELLGHAIFCAQLVKEAGIWLMRVRDCPRDESAGGQACRMREIAREGLKAIRLAAVADDRQPATADQKKA